MKIFEIENNFPPARKSEMVSWRFLADSAMSNLGKPFFIPEETDEVSICVSPAVRISRLGKSVEKKFSHRYYDALAPGVHFILNGLLNELENEKFSTDAAYSFDKAFFCGNFEEYNDIFDGSASFHLTINGEKAEEWNIGYAYRNIDELIPLVSKMNTIKIGDLIIPGESKAHRVKKDDRVELTYNNTTVLSIKIK